MTARAKPLNAWASLLYLLAIAGTFIYILWSMLVESFTGINLDVFGILVLVPLYLAISILMAGTVALMVAWFLASALSK